jgi:membrane-bound lytic murein transglycosylase B
MLRHRKAGVRGIDMANQSAHMWRATIILVTAVALSACVETTSSVVPDSTGYQSFAQAPATVAQPPVAAIAPAPAPPREWTGESGASGHPTMQASAIRAAAANFPACLEGLWPLAAKRNVSRATYDKYVTGLTPDLRIMDLLDAQPEFTKAFWDYLDILVSDARIQTGRALLAQHKAILDRVEQEYGVDRHIIVAIWGVESNYGTLGGERPVIRSTATLACVGRRQAYFRDEFLSTLEILHRGDVRQEQLKGSWAGAFGPTQFMPTSFKRFAVDFGGRPAGPRARPGDTRSSSPKASTTCLPTARTNSRSASGRQRELSARAASRSRAQPTAPICWCPPVTRGPAS